MSKFAPWTHPETKKVRVYFNHGYEEHRVKAWFEKADHGGWFFKIKDHKPDTIEGEQKEEITDNVRLQLLNSARRDLEKLSKKPLEEMTFNDLLALAYEMSAAKQKRNNKHSSSSCLRRSVAKGKNR